VKTSDTPVVPVADLADRLFRAEHERRPIAPLTEMFPSLSLADAYQIQRLNVERRLQRGQRILGHKIGLTAKAMQEKFGVSEPDYGHLLDTMFLPAGPPLDLGELIDPQIEVEPAFVLGADLKGPGVTIADVLAATDYVSVCFEVIDSRIVNWQIKLPDTVADNGSSSRVLLGPERHKPWELALDNLETVLEIDGKVLETGNTRAILGHPASGIAWLANALAPYGIALEAGHIVLPGTCTRSRKIGGHREVKGRIESLGEVKLALSGEPRVRNTEEF
jgi:2-keto-4-pentenoate hydratase